MARGYVSFVLHAHLPYVRHAECSDALEEVWLFEALIESYLPLLAVFRRLRAQGVRYRVALSLSPTLLSMLRDPLLQQRFQQYFQRLRALTDRELVRTRRDSAVGPVVQSYKQRFQELATLLDDVGGDVVGAFAQLARSGELELLTTAATHAFLPLFVGQPSSIRAQLRTGAAELERATGLRPRGLWLPECGYFPGLEAAIADAGFEWTVLEQHGVRLASPSPEGGLTPVGCNNGVAAFGRDSESSHQVWSSTQGYPGDPWYREFYRDIGLDLPLELLGDFAVPGRPRVHTGLKYHRVTGRTEQKQIYEPHQADSRARDHAIDFVEQRRRQLLGHAGGERPPIVVAPYDAELFGHWWYEGPRWLELVLRGLAEETELETITPSAYLQRHPRLFRAQPAASSWGAEGYNGFWLNETNDWVYPLLYREWARFSRASAELASTAQTPLLERVRAQGARELLLAQASDWPFILRTGTTVAYAERRLTEHLSRLQFLTGQLQTAGASGAGGDSSAALGAAVDERKLAALEALDPIFPNIDFRLFEGGAADAARS